MWLINTTTLQLEHFTPPNVPPYAILSHTWGHTCDDEELNFQEFNDLGQAKTRKGFSKVRKTCELARDRGIQYAWVDTCCIDKSSSAELSESINSMYKWYRQSEICYAYMSDWPPETDWADLDPIAPGDSKIEDSTDDYSSISGSEDLDQVDNPNNGPGSNVLHPPLRWFTRGWTLQELIAPTEIEFYDQAWNLRGLKSDPLVVSNISRITGITPFIIEDGNDGRLREICLGQRMSWAANRETFRIEDTAYCLLGIFQVNMPLLYGEGDKAFLRLQEEIIKFSTDLSIFAWSQRHQDGREFRGIFSCHPREFADLKDCHLANSPFSQAEEFTLTNKGLRISTRLLYLPSNDTLFMKLGMAFMYLGCMNEHLHLGIILKNVDDLDYVRAKPDGLVIISDTLRRDEARNIYVARDWDHYANKEYAAAVATGVELNLEDTEDYMFEIEEAWPPGIHDHIQKMILVKDLTTIIGFLRVAVLERKSLPEARRQVGEIVVVYHWANDNISVLLLKGARAADFIEYTKSMWRLDPITAQLQLFARVESLDKKSSQEIAIQDSLTGARLCIRAIILVNNRQARVGWPNIHLTRIKVDLTVLHPPSNDVPI